MTNGMIFGLVFSTGLTLVVVPTLYVMLHRGEHAIDQRVLAYPTDGRH